MRCVLIPAFLLSMAVIGFSKTIHVPGDYSKIQEAVDASVNGDVVLVHPGTYTENIDFKGKAITLKSEKGSDVTAIDGSNPQNIDYGSVVIFQNGEGNESILQGFTITNGTGTLFQLWNSYEGGGIFILNSNPTIINNNIINNSAIHHGGGISCEYSSPIIINNTIESNSATIDSGDGGGIFAGNNSNPMICNNLIHNNYALHSGGGIRLFISSSPEIISNTIHNNVAQTGGGLFIRDNCSPIIINSILWDNTAEDGPEISIHESSILNISYTNLKGGQSSVEVDPTSTIIWDLGIIDADPLFFDKVNNDFHLSQDPCQQGIVNPCVDAGDPSSSMIIGTTRTDGIQDMAIVDMGFHYQIKVYDYLIADQSVISELTGGIINFGLTAGTGNSKRNYILLGSLSGTEPGIQLPGGLVVLPLNWDLFTDLIIAYMNSSFFMNFMGVLNPSGNGAAIFNSQGPLPSGMVGFTFSFAYALNKPWDFVSNPVAIEIVP